MFGYFGQAYLGGAVYDGDLDGGGTTPPPPTGNAVLAADAATAVDWDVTTQGLGDDETATASETVVATGLDVGSGGGGNGDTFVDDSATAIESAVATGLGGNPNPGGGGTTPPPVFVQKSVIKFVDSVSLTATTRLDLENVMWRVLFEGTDTPPPPMEDQRVSSMLGDGEHISASVYRNREINLALLLTAASPDLGAQQIQALQRELDRPRNVLWWQPDINLPPVFFRTFRGPDVVTKLDFGLIKHRIDLTIEAEPFALGPEVGLGTLTVNQDPAASTNPTFLDLTGIKGDVETPLYVSMTNQPLSGQHLAIATRKRGTPSAVRWFRQAEDTGLTLGLDATRTSAADASGGSAVRVSFATQSGNASRLSGAFPFDTGSSVDWPGTYRVMARVRVSTGTVKMQLSTGSSVSSRNTPTTIDGNGAFVMADLGLVRLPLRSAGRSAGYGPDHAAIGSTLSFYAERTVGAGTLEIDFIQIVPADEEYAFVQAPVSSGLILDGPNGDVYAHDGAGHLAPIGALVPYIDGSLPTVSPRAATNRVFFINGVGLPTSGGITGSFQMTLSYWPRYRIVRPVLT